MKKMYVIFLLLLLSCSEKDIQGNWLVVKHDFNSEQVDPPDFQLISIINNKIYIDIDSSFYSLKNDSLTFYYKKEFQKFFIRKDGDYMYMMSNSYKNGGITSIFLKRETPSN